MTEHAKTSICAHYKSVDGWHVFYSDELPGLYVASKDAEAAFMDVAPAIEKLLHLDEGIQCRAFPLMSLQDFLDASKNPEPAEQGSAPLEISAKRFAVVEWAEAA